MDFCSFVLVFQGYTCFNISGTKLLSLSVSLAIETEISLTEWTILVRRIIQLPLTNMILGGLFRVVKYTDGPRNKLDPHLYSANFV